MLTSVKIYNRFWRDNKVKALSPNGKYLFSYLVSSPYNNELGLYFVPLTSISHDTGLEENVVKVEIVNLVTNNLVKYDFDNEVVFISNFLRFNGEDISVEEIKMILENLPETSLVNDFLISCQENNKYLSVEEIEELKNNFRPVMRGMEMKESSVPEIVEAENPVEPPTNKDAEEAVEPTPVVEDDSVKKAKTSAKEETPAPKRGRKKKEKSEDEKNEEQRLKDFFASLVEMYPKREGMVPSLLKADIKQAEKNFLNALKKGNIEEAEAKFAVENYAREAKDKNTSAQYVIKMANFFGKAERYKEFLNDPDNILRHLSYEERTELANKFVQFWENYPKQEGKELALRSFNIICTKNINTAEELIEASRKYAEYCYVRHTEPQFIMKANNFLNLDRKPYRDYINTIPDATIVPSNTATSMSVMEEPVNRTETFVEINERMAMNNSGTMEDDDDLFEDNVTTEEMPSIQEEIPNIGDDDELPEVTPIMDDDGLSVVDDDDDDDTPW